MNDITDRYIRKKVEFYSIKGVYSSITKIIMKAYIQRNLVIGLCLFIFITLDLSIKGLTSAGVMAASIVFLIIFSLSVFLKLYFMPIKRHIFSF